ncbi:F-box-like domain protein [Rhizoctonia solani AG-3 Rhs1AP]|uniref:F-box-like domain protein n=2 Tax=Rhizoctonia solani AG-3 TaxID=1086053 RepID=A0A074RQZ8_9AGAM|nr:F-box-like domain protein [Rhizoctonia solani AG-3 Rhs1AP]KEP47730.1 F-box-like domain protein [Rhizoctonia solani 123E]
MNELTEASDLLRSSLARYTNACFSAVEACKPLASPSRVLFDCIVRELRMVANYEVNIKVAKSALTQCANYRPTSPINTLPSEIIIRIFTLLIKSVTLPEILSHVCSRWRRIALAVPELWTHIDIISDESRHTKIMARSQLFASRIGVLHPKVHISIPPEYGLVTPPQAFQQELRFASSTIAPRIKSFRLDDSSAGSESLVCFVNYFLPHITPGALKRLVLLDHSDDYSRSSFLSITDPREHGPEDQQWPGAGHRQTLRVSMSLLDEILRPVQILWLRNQFFPWRSLVYSGLVDLRLLQSRYFRDGVQINIVTLVNILRSCPGLRVFHCEIELDSHTLHTSSPIPPVTLTELEDLRIHNMLPTQSKLLLPYIFPGPKPLGFFIQVAGRSSSKSFFPAVVLAFLRRSNVTKLFIKTQETAWISVVTIASALPGNLNTLSLQGFWIVPEGTNSAHPGFSRVAKVNTLILQRVKVGVGISAIQQFSSICAVQELILDSDSLPHLGFMMVTALEELRQTIPVVRCTLGQGEYRGSWILA